VAEGLVSGAGTIRRASASVESTRRRPDAPRPDKISRARHGRGSGSGPAPRAAGLVMPRIIARPYDKVPRTGSPGGRLGRNIMVQPDAHANSHVRGWRRLTSK
jgi:hypothetical protein